MRLEYELTSDELEEIRVSSHIPYLVAGSNELLSPQELANHKWKALAEKKGFVRDTADHLNFFSVSLLAIYLFIASQGYVDQELSQLLLKRF